MAITPRIMGSAGALDVQFGASVPRNVPTWFAVKTTSAFDSSTGYSWEEMRSAPGAGYATPDLPLAGDLAYALDNDTSFAVGTICFMFIDRDQTTYGLILATDSGGASSCIGCGWVAGLNPLIHCLAATVLSRGGACDCPPVTYNCPGAGLACVDPGDGTGTYTTLAACITAGCIAPPPPPPPPPPVSFNCVLGACVDPGDGTGTYPSVAACLGAGCGGGGPGMDVTPACPTHDPITGGSCALVPVTGDCAGIVIPSGFVCAGDSAYATGMVAPLGLTITCNPDGSFTVVYTTGTHTYTVTGTLLSCGASGSAPITLTCVFSFSGEDPCTGVVRLNFTLTP